MQEVEKKGRAALYRVNSALKAGSVSYTQGGGRTRFSVTYQPLPRRLRVAVQDAAPRYTALVLPPADADESALLYDAPQSSWAGLWVLDGDEPVAVCRLSAGFDPKAARPALEAGIAAHRAGQTARARPIPIRKAEPAPSRQLQRQEAEPASHCLRAPLYSPQPPIFYENLFARFSPASPPALRAAQQVSFRAHGLHCIQGKVHFNDKEVLVQAVSAGNPVLRPPELNYTILSEQGEVLWCRYDAL
ncbi:MAG: hypothetical protein PHO66_00670 [Eubacteriales bacterium]|nr:hypothetical protein [Eubacteriales bacterium]